MARGTGVLAIGVGSLFAGLLLTGCASMSESLACPGEQCPSGLAAVADEVSRAPGVTGVDRTWRRHTLSDRPSGGVDLHAAVSDDAAARSVAERAAALYRAQDVGRVDRIEVRVVPDPEIGVRRTLETVLGGGPSYATDVSCAAVRCLGSLMGFRDAFADSLGEVAVLNAAGWDPGGQRPEVLVELTVPNVVLDAAGYRDLRERLCALAVRTRLVDDGRVRAVIHFRERVEYTYFLPGNRT